MGKSNLWRGMTALLALIVCLTSFGTSLAFTREGDVNLFLGTLPPAVAVTDDTNYYKSSYASMDEMRQAQQDYLIESQIEGERRPAPGQGCGRHPLRLCRRHPRVPRRLRRPPQHRHQPLRCP